MVHGQQQHVVVCSASRISRPRISGPALQVEGRAGFLGVQPLEFALSRRRCPRRSWSQGEAGIGARRSRGTGWPSSSSEARAQGFVPGHDAVQRRAQRVAVQLAAQPQPAGMW